jgi:hypothetical protein
MMIGHHEPSLPLGERRTSGNRLRHPSIWGERRLWGERSGFGVRAGTCSHRSVFQIARTMHVGLVSPHGVSPSPQRSVSISRRDDYMDEIGNGNEVSFAS